MDDRHDGNADQQNLSQTMTVSEVCALLRIHRSSLYRLIKAGELPAFKIARDYRFDREDIDRWRLRQGSGVTEGDHRKP